MELREIGAMLREERERRGLVLDDIAQQTRISLSSLQGIESGLSELLPHPVYAKGFIKVYAQFLGMDLTEALSDFSTDTTGHYRPVYRQAVPDEETDHPDVRALRSGNRLGIAAVALLVAAAGATYWYFSHTAGNAPEIQSANLQKLEARLVPDAPADATTESSVESKAVTIVELESQAVQNAAPATTVEPHVAAAVTPEPLQPAPVTSPEQAAPSQPANPIAVDTIQQHQANEEQPTATSILVVHAREACWMQAKHADGTVREYMLQPGGRTRLSFTGTLNLMLGNAGGVDLVINGQPYALNAQSGQVRRLTLP